MVNKVTLVGNVTAEPEVKALGEGGVKVANIRVATNKSYKDKNGEWQEKGTFHNVVLWRNHAESAEKRIIKGTLVYIEGEIDNREYVDKEGNKRYITEIVAKDMKILNKAAGDKAKDAIPYKDGQMPNSNTQATQQSSTAHLDTTNNNVEEDDLPF